MVRAKKAQMLEVEAKYPLQDAVTLIGRLRQLGATLIEDRTDADHYFNAPDRDFATTDEAFRLRRIGNRNFLTYKGPKLDAVTKTRKEIEVAVADGADSAQDLTRLFESLGYRPVAVVRKQRTVYALGRDGFHLEFCFDDVEGVGKFVEIEIMAGDEDYSRARDLLQAMAAELGLGATERRSYFQMLLTANQKDHG